VTVRKVDLRTADWAECLKDIDIIHHFAWESVPSTANSNVINDFEVHVAGTLRLLEAARSLGGKRVVFLSSGGTVYGRLDRGIAHESDRLWPIGAYGGGKATVETYLRVYHQAGWLEGRVARLSNPYGTGQVSERGQGVLGVFLRAALAGAPLHIFGDGEVVRDYIHVTDAAEALTRLSIADLSSSPEMPLFNIGSGIGVSINQLVSTIEDQVGPLLVKRGQGRAYDVPVSVLDTNSFVRALDFAPRVDLGEGIASTIADMRADNTLLSTLSE
jgi:UDP-glucose 4-epimerase